MIFENAVINGGMSLNDYNIKDVTTNVRNVDKVYDLSIAPEIWQAETGTKYVEQYFDLEPGLKETVELISDMVTQMNQISTNFQDTDTGMAGQM